MIILLVAAAAVVCVTIAATLPDKEMRVWREKYDTEKQIERIDEALAKCWFPGEEDHAILRESRAQLNKKLGEITAKYEEAKKEVASKIVEQTLKKTFPRKTSP